MLEANLGDVISAVYAECLTRYGGDAELASVATAAVVNDLLAEPPSVEN